jgi:hypothetical protein
MRVEDTSTASSSWTCSGNVTHQLTVLVDGRVRVRVGR